MSSTKAQDPDAEKYYSSFITFWKWSSTYGLLIGGPLTGLLWISGVKLDLAAILTLGAFALFCIALMAYPVTISPDGIKTYDYFGRYMWVPWDTAIEVKYVKVFGLKYLVINSPDIRRELYLPLYLRRTSRFIETIKRYLAEDHSLVIALEAHADRRL